MLLLVDSVTLHMFSGVFALGFVVFLFKYAYILQVLSSVDVFFFSKRTLQNVPLLLTLQVSLSWCLQMGNPDYRQNWVLSDFQGMLRTFSCMQFMCCLYWCAPTSPGSLSAPVCRLPLGPQSFEDSRDGLYLQEQLGWSFSF